MDKILVTGGAGFIGSNLVEVLLERDYSVRVIDNLSTGNLDNIREFQSHPDFEFVEGDIRDYSKCTEVIEGCTLVSHQAALGSVPRSVKDPLTTNEVNISGTLNVFQAAKESGIRRVVYAASSSTYGDSKSLPKQEDKIGNPLSPYAVTKLVNEIYADIYFRVYGLEVVGLRYFNIFGPKQNPNGPYAAVIPLFIQAVLNGSTAKIFGDGEQSRDFTFVSNAIQSNILALEQEFIEDRIFNVACGEQITINQLVREIENISGLTLDHEYLEKRDGDILHSLADISRAKTTLGYEPSTKLKEGLRITFNWFKENQI